MFAYLVSWSLPIAISLVAAYAAFTVLSLWFLWRDRYDAAYRTLGISLVFVLVLVAIAGALGAGLGQNYDEEVFKFATMLPVVVFLVARPDIATNLTRKLARRLGLKTDEVEAAG